VRLDKFLKVSRLIKQRQKAKELCDYGRVKIQGKVQKAGTQISEGDIIEIVVGNRKVSAEVIRIPDKHVSKKNAATLIQMINEEIIDEDW
jgi:ribosomal 50S subunit-recycling heat shock protein